MSLVVLGDGINFVAGIVSSMILARIIAVEIMGTYRQIMYLCLLVATLLEFGLSASIYRFWNQFNNTDKGTYAKMLILTACSLGALGSAIFAVLAYPISVWYKNDMLLVSLLIAAPFPLATIPLMLLRPVLLCEGYPIKATLIETLFTLISVAAIVVPLWLGFTFLTALAIWIAASLTRLSAVPFILWPYIRQTGRWWNYKLLREVWAYLWPIQAGRLPGYITGYLDKIVASIYFTPQRFAVYSLGAREIPFIGMIGPSAAGVLIPHLVKDEQDGNIEQICRRWRLTCEKTALATYLIAAFCIWYAIPVMQFMFSNTYSESSVPFRVFAALTFFRVIEYSSLAKAIGRSDIIMKSAFIGAGSIVPLIFILTKYFGMFGMAQSFLWANVLSALYLLFQYKKIFNRPITDFFPWMRLVSVGIIALASVVISSLLSGRMITITEHQTIIALGWRLVVLFGFSGVLYGALLLLCGFIRLPLIRSNKSVPRNGAL